MKLKHIKVDKHVYEWECPICKKRLARHRTDGLNRWSNIQSKGAASRHLMMHNYDYTKHNREVKHIIDEQDSDGYYKSIW